MYNSIATPLTNLLKKNTPFVWNEKCQDAFEKLKSALCSEPILVYPDFTKQFYLTTDASTKALGQYYPRNMKERIYQSHTYLEH